MDGDHAHLDDVPLVTNDGDARGVRVFLEMNVVSVAVDDVDAHKAVVHFDADDRLVLRHDVPGHFTRIDVGRLQSPIPDFVVTR